MMEQAVQPGRIARIDELVAGEGGTETDELGFATGLRFAVPLGIGLWALLIWTVVRFLA